MGEFLSGRKIDRGFLKAVDYMTDWRSRFGLPKGQAIPEDMPNNMFGIVSSGIMNKLQPVGESVGGLTMTSPQAVEAVGRGLQRLLKQSWGDKILGAKNAHETMRMLKLLPDYALDFVDDIKTVNKLKRISSGAEDPIGRAHILPSGATIITRTHRLPPKGMAHEIGHSYDTAMAASTKNTKRSQYAKLLEEMTRISRGATNRYTAKKKAWGEEGIRYSDYKYVNAREILARNFANKMTVALKGRNNPLIKTEFKNIYKNSLYDTVNLIKEKAPNLLKKGKEAMVKKYRFRPKSIKIKHKTESEKLENTMLGWGLN